MAEIAGALGAEFVVYGQVGSLGELLVVQLNLVDTGRAEVLARESFQVSSLTEVPPALDAAVARLVTPAGFTLETAAPEEPEPRFNVWTAVPFGVAAGGAGVFLVGIGGLLWGGLPLALYAFSSIQAANSLDQEHIDAVNAANGYARFYNDFGGIGGLVGGAVGVVLGVVLAVGGVATGGALLMLGGE